MSKYHIGTTEDEFEPGSGGHILRNKLAITDEEDMAEVETQLLLKLYEYVFQSGVIESEHLSVGMLFEWHRKWLGNVYYWAGERRTVNMGKGGFEFTAAAQILKCLTQFEKEYLSKFNGLNSFSRDEVVRYLAESHVEFILIHPFREGNGRLSRLILDVMAVKAGYLPLDYGIWEQNRDFYFKSIQAGLGGDYQHMARLVNDVLSAKNE
ncbi:Fic/DOC family protein [Shewanella septentrionalis]|uniref:Fic family protein n=1 Tax=Shewanella septentrionalis TaxID=2952223 RepID=A0A9X3ATW2_9GAMM|nr:Fic family protein [Shewanella septentrionalis]MCT7945586.1 Fic family protein [Shewanella septentrionalis]